MIDRELKGVWNRILFDGFRLYCSINLSPSALCDRSVRLMNRCAFAFLLIVLTTSIYGNDLESARTALKHEPEYKSSRPGYLLLVFGQKMDRRVWVVADKENVYIDRNSNGDLTEPNECCGPSKVARFTGPDAVFEEYRTYQLGDLPGNESSPRYTKLQLFQSRQPTENFPAETERDRKEKARRTEFPHLSGNLSVRIDNNDEDNSFRQNAGPIFGTSPEKAPIVHFDGPLSLTVEDGGGKQPIKIEPVDGQIPFQFRLGTPGVGEHSFAYTEASKLPSLEAIVQNRKGESQSADVKLRYCGADYCTTITLPPAISSKPLDVTVAVPDFAGRNVSPLDLKIEIEKP